MQRSLFDDPIPATQTNDYYVLPASEKQISFAKDIALRARTALPDDILTDRRKLSEWIDRHQSAVKALKSSRFASYPSSKQVAYAERIARIKRREVPHECFRDKLMMSKWIDSNR